MLGTLTAKGEPSARRVPRLLLASACIAAPSWIRWAINGRGLTGARATTMVLAANAVVTRLAPSLKSRVVRTVQRYLINPPVRLLVGLGVLPLGLALVETVGRRSGRPRVNPVGDGLEGNTFWIVVEHGGDAGYVRNIRANPHVRVKVREGLRATWRDGVAVIMDRDDPSARQRQLCRWHPLRALNAVFVRAMGTDLLTVRIDLRPSAG